MTDIVKIQEEVNTQIANPQVLNALITTTFKGLQPETMKRAIMEGMMRGFEFKDFLEKNVYAIPYSGSYSLVTSIDYARKIGMRSGVVGKSAPTFEEKDGVIISCTVTVKRKVNDYVGEYTATVFFKEYTTGKNLWTSKPHTMIAKVAEMHALRMACPEELSEQYIEDEMNEPEKITINLEDYEATLRATTTLEDLKHTWSALPATAKKELGGLKDELKATLAATEQSPEATHVQSQAEEEKFLAKHPIDDIPL